MAPTFAGRGLQPGPAHRRDKRLDDKVLTHLDNFKINPTYNMDGAMKSRVPDFSEDNLSCANAAIT